MFQKIGFLLFFFAINLQSQNIKTIQLRPLQEKVFTSIVPLGTVLKLSFDDLDADSKNYDYKIEHMTNNWQKSRLLSSQYIDGFDQNTILEVTNSFNTFQGYTHYEVEIPNINTVIKKSGNYLLSVIDEDDEIVFSRKFVLYENKAIVGVSVERSRNTKTVNTQQTIQFSVNHPNLRINNPAQEINVVILKNENWDEKITNLQPTFFKQNQLLYTYTNRTNFWGDNEYYNIDTKTIRNKSLGIQRIELKDVFHHYIYPTTYNEFEEYTYRPDINGQFLIRTLEGNDERTEADYAMMHFTLDVDAPFAEKEVYVYGAFNNFKTTKENTMYYDLDQKVYKANFLLKQGFYNYTFATIGTDNTLNLREVNGTFFETENTYTVLVYYKAFGDMYERVIGIGTGFFNQNR
jgi:hypothetical protein